MTKSNFRPIGRNLITGRQTCWGTSQNRARCGAVASLSEQGVHSDRIPRGDRDTDGERDFGRSQAVFPACQRSREAAVRPKILPHARWTTAQGWARCHAGASVSPLGLHCGRTPWENRVTERSQGFGRSQVDVQPGGRALEATAQSSACCDPGHLLSGRSPLGNRVTERSRGFGRSQADVRPVVGSRQAGWPAGPRPRAGPGVTLEPLSPGNRSTEHCQAFGRPLADFQQPVVASRQAGGPAGPLPGAGPGVTLEPGSPADRPWETGVPVLR